MSSRIRTAAAPVRRRLSIELLEDRLSPATLTVVNAFDSGHGSLRAAINLANLNVGPDSIVFNIPGAGVHTINLTSPLPAITGQVTLNGQTQPGFDASTNRPVIELNGAGAGLLANGIQIDPTGAGTVIRGLAINRFSFNGIQIDADNCRVRSCFIGTDATGTIARPNSTGVRIDAGASGNTIGGTLSAARNVLSGNTGYGVDIIGAGANANLVQGNFIGTDRTGTAGLGNGNDGILIEGGAKNNLVGGTVAGSRNVISGNTFGGVTISGSGTSGNAIQGNRIGTDRTGSADLGNGLSGVSINSGASNNAVGGAALGAGNLISGNDNGGIRLADAGTSGNKVQGNYIGTNQSGALAVANSFTGVAIVASASNNIVGGLAVGTGNVISGNAGTGILIDGLGTTGNSLRANRIGLAATTSASLGNGGFGVFITDQAEDNTIGGAAFGAGNVIAHNGNSGILIGSDPGGGFPTAAEGGNSVLGNRIFGNGGLGIDLGPNDGVTANDTNDPDTGPNDLLNYPSLTLAKRVAAGLKITGSINTEQNKTLRIEFFASPSADPSGYGEGQRYLGSLTVTMGTNNTVNFSTTLPVSGVLAGQVVTATATDELGNTSEFSFERFVT